jgi:hypothetical protein
LRHLLFILVFASIIGSQTDAHAQLAFDHAWGSAGLDQGACLQFVDRNAVEARTARWLEVIEATWKTDPDFVANWMVGKTPPPPQVLIETQRQKDCMLRSLVFDSAKNDVILDWGDQRNTALSMGAISERFERDRRFQSNLLQWWTRSSWRGSQEQSWIWHRKFTFNCNSFNRVSDHAAGRCPIEAGRTWNPGLPGHNACWRDTLNDDERQKEILMASAAPGISRHHWGSDYDLFSLNPRNFLEGQAFNDEWTWMRTNAIQHGFFQPYQPHEERHAYMEERWHWSYAPVGQALTHFATRHQDELGVALGAQWDDFESRWGSKRRSERHFFSYVREHWRDYMFTIETNDP